MIIAYCKDCKVLLPPMSEDLRFDPPADSCEFYCNACMRKRLGDAQVDHIENNAVDEDDIEKLNG